MGVDSLITPKKLDGVTNVEMIIIFPALNFQTEFKNTQPDDGKRWVVNILIWQHEKGGWVLKDITARSRKGCSRCTCNFDTDCTASERYCQNRRNLVNG